MADLGVDPDSDEDSDMVMWIQGVTQAVGHNSASMDFLKAEIANKKRDLEHAEPSRPNKYMRRGDIEKLRKQEEEEEQARLMEKRRKDEEQSVSKVCPTVHFLQRIIDLM